MLVLLAPWNMLPGVEMERWARQCMPPHSLRVIAPADLACRAPVWHRDVDDPTSQRAGRPRTSEGRAGIGLGPHIDELGHLL